MPPGLSPVLQLSLDAFFIEKSIMWERPMKGLGAGEHFCGLIE